MATTWFDLSPARKCYEGVKAAGLVLLSGAVGAKVGVAVYEKTDDLTTSQLAGSAAAIGTYCVGDAVVDKVADTIKR